MDGCDGGNPDSAFEYLKRHGVVEESVYPYTGKDSSTCEVPSS